MAWGRGTAVVAVDQKRLKLRRLTRDSSTARTQKDPLYAVPARSARHIRL